MSETRISQLSAFAEPPADDDILIINDVSDFTQSDQGSTKTVTVAKLLANAGGGGSSGVGFFVTDVTCGTNATFDDGIVQLTRTTGDTPVANITPVTSAVVDTPTVRVTLQWEGGVTEWTGAPTVDGTSVSNVTAIGGDHARRFQGHVDLDLTAHRNSTVSIPYSYNGIYKYISVDVAGLGPSVVDLQVISNPEYGQDHYKDGDSVTLQVEFDSEDIDTISFSGGDDVANGTVAAANFTKSGKVATITTTIDTTITTKVFRPFRLTAKNALGTAGETHTSTATVEVVSGPLVQEFSIGSFPNGQTELKNGDTIPVTIRFDTTNVNKVRFSGGETEASTTQTIENITMNGTSTPQLSMSVGGTTAVTPSDLTIKARGQGVGHGGLGGPVADSGAVTVTVNNITPTIATPSITYPSSQQALKGTEQATVAAAVTNAGASATYSYTSPNGELLIASPNSYSANKTVTRSSGGYNVTTNNFTLTVTRTENGAQSSKSAIVFIADTSPTLTVASNGGARMRSGGNDGTTIQAYSVVITTGGQRLLQAPTLTAPVGNLGNFNHSATATSFNATMTVHDNDAKGEHTYSAINAVNLAGKTVTTIGSGDKYTFGGFVSRTKTLTAQTNEVQINVLPATYSKVTMSWSGNSNVTSRQPIDTTTQTTNGWCLASTTSTPVTVRILDTSKTAASTVNTTITIQEAA